MTSFSSSTVEIRQRAGASSGRPKPSTSGPRISCAGPDLVDRTATSGALTGLTDEIATLRTALETIATRVRHHEEQLRRLTARKTENINRPKAGKQDH